MSRSRRGKFLDWLVALAIAATIAAAVHRSTAERVRHLGSRAFPAWMWRLYDWKVWPLSRLR